MLHAVNTWCRLGLLYNVRLHVVGVIHAFGCVDVCVCVCACVCASCGFAVPKR